MFSAVPTEIIPEARTFTEKDVQKLLTSLPPSVVENCEASDIDSDHIKQCDHYLKDNSTDSKN